ncbi:hypothetical protein [Wenzhouxiangella sp. EGI_FJ10305]|uniref:hypothetical protein n=1 Tax=Wenzhouxiangella sp. EGI_FJ10305 TaxID=3243768 RepID=UPI0035DF71C0
MPESKHDEGRETAEASESSRDDAPPQHGGTDSYLDHVRSVFSSPDEALLF